MSTDDDKPMTEDEAIDAALAEIDRDEEGACSESDVLDLAVKYVHVDVDAIKRAALKRALDKRRRPGATPPEGQLSFPEIPPYAYEPQRLVSDSQGRIIEQDKANFAFKTAENERKRRNAMRAQVSAERSTKETQGYAAWAMEQHRTGREASEITFGTYVRESGVWVDAVAPPAADDDA